MSPGADYSTPPSQWAGATEVGPDVYVLAAEPKTGGDVIVWHWCTRRKAGPPVTGPQDDERWAGAACSNHQLLAARPLHLSPSLACADCDWHGFIEHGAWRPV